MKCKIFFILWFIFIWFLAAVCHEGDIAYNCKRDGNAHTWVFDISCNKGATP